MGKKSCHNRPDPAILPFRLMTASTRPHLCAALAAAVAAGGAQAQNEVPSLSRAGLVTHGDAVIERGATDGSAVVRLRSASRIDWQPFSLDPGESLRIRSENGSFASLHRVRGGLPARINGSVVADGPFYLVSPGGISVGATGSVQAPRVFMSALAAADEVSLLNGGSTTFSKAGSGLVDISGAVHASGGLLTLVGANLTVTPTGSLHAPGGQVQAVAADTAIVSGSGPAGVTSLPPGPRNPASRANLTTTGRIVGWRIDLISEGFIRNGGRLDTSGPGNRVLLSATASTHELRPRNASIIITDDLVAEGEFRPEGPVISPRDGANPSAVGGQRQTPRLSQPGFITQSDSRTTQLAYSPLQTLTTTSPIPPPARAASVASRRGSDTDTDERRRQAARRATVRKASFFGQTVKK
jgi:filamentous hemagglutinin family protein